MYRVTEDVVVPYLRSGSLPSGEEELGLRTLLAPGELAAALDRYSVKWGADACRQASASLWSKSLFAALLPGPTWLALTGRAIPAEPKLAVAGGVPEGFVVPAPSGPCGDPDATSLAAFLIGPVTGSVAALVSASGLAPRVFWSNAASMLAWLIERFEAIPETAEAARGFRAAILNAGSLPPHGVVNPMANLIGYVPTAVPGYPGVTRRRRVCCLWDRLEADQLCASCPKIDPADREAQLLAAMSVGKG